MKTLEEIALQVADGMPKGFLWADGALHDDSGVSGADVVEFARRLVNALQADGWQMVPKEPTPEMVKASWDMAGLVRIGEGQYKYITVAYQAMLAAAPKPSPR